MKILYKTLISLAIVVAIVVVVEILTTRPTPNFTIETLSASCMTEERDLDIKAERNSIVIIAPVQTPNPCYSVVGGVKFSGRDIEVDLSTVSKQDICIQCIGEVTGKVVIQNLTKGTYGIKVNTPDRAAITTIMIE